MNNAQDPPFAPSFYTNQMDPFSEMDETFDFFEHEGLTPPPSIVSPLPTANQERGVLGDLTVPALNWNKLAAATDVLQPTTSQPSNLYDFDMGRVDHFAPHVNQPSPGLFGVDAAVLTHASDHAPSASVHESLIREVSQISDHLDAPEAQTLREAPTRSLTPRRQPE